MSTNGPVPVREAGRGPRRLLAWAGYSDGERRRMLEVIDLFREKGL